MGTSTDLTHTTRLRSTRSMFDLFRRIIRFDDDWSRGIDLLHCQRHRNTFVIGAGMDNDPASIFDARAVEDVGARRFTAN